MATFAHVDKGNRRFSWRSSSARAKKAEAVPGIPLARLDSLFSFSKALIRANLRRLVKRILRKHGYPPDKQEKATRTMLEQAEVLSAGWAV